MPSRTGHRSRPPLDPATLDALALHYVGRFATSKSKLVTYLNRKVRERGWEDVRAPEANTIAERLANLGYIDDSAFALAKARALSGRGYGARRVSQALHGAGISEEDGVAARDLAHGARIDAAVRLARRRRIGPFAPALLDTGQREKAIAAMLRAGHSFVLARAIVDLPPGDRIDLDALAEVR